MRPFMAPCHSDAMITKTKMVVEPFLHEHNSKKKKKKFYSQIFKVVALKFSSKDKLIFAKKCLIYQNKFQVFPTSLAYLKNKIFFFFIKTSDDNSTKQIYYSQKIMAVRNTSGFKVIQPQKAAVFFSLWNF